MQAGTTEANFRNAALMIDPHQPVVLISSNYHMERVVNIAHQAGFVNVYRMPARSARISYGVNVLWEIIIDLNNFVESL
ncbi:MAG: YdcF family protein [Clostridiales bacterium]|nr:YdcF family protein [Clostridiales bacterium]